MRTFVTQGDGLPVWDSPISHAVVVNDICYLSGQLSIDSAGRHVPGSARQEAARAFDNLFAALAAAGFAREDLTFIDIAFIDLADLPEVNALYIALFAQGRRPARTIYQAAALPYGGRIKVMGVAIRDTAGQATTQA
ncbi:MULTISPECIES: RidA family protein [unclassified Xanthomonas]|uniref:RidA family protein n=1 Tax=unclassified Xanthomonas TaxID=2643310 RepID=UPI00162287B2|nr:MULTISPECIES: RidA family protein [unclassified Xanthomonas]MBB4131389.1 2-iminobutanoate/2-iminopropanoate deaminase [Xanthomonas sp. 3075]MBB5865606.1 2-iminobutanoate/2-iminopropanoate deaminase [Xanthomonas sp. 3058]